MARAVSTVLDVSVCLLFVAAAVVTLAGTPPPADSSKPPATIRDASSVSTVTTAVSAGEERLAHDTLAGHLGRATVVGARIDGDPFTNSEYPTAVENATANLTADRTFLTARWEPYPGAPLAGDIAVGAEPPPTADVTARTLIVDSGVATPQRPDSFARLAEQLAAAYVTRLFPPERTYTRAVDGRTAPETVGRYRIAGDALGIDTTPAAADAEIRRANAAVADALATRLEADLRTRYATPEAAATNLTVDEVEIVVRRWVP